MSRKPFNDPEELIRETRTVIQVTNRAQDRQFEELVATLGLTKEGEDWLFDYVYNYGGDETFTEYLERRGKSFGEMK